VQTDELIEGQEYIYTSPHKARGIVIRKQVKFLGVKMKTRKGGERVEKCVIVAINDKTNKRKYVLSKYLKKVAG